MKIGIIGAGPVGREVANYFANLGAVVSLYSNGRKLEATSEHMQVKPFKVERVQKRFLETDEDISDGSRMRDLFRLFYSIEPEDNVLARVKENPEVFEKLGEEVINSLGFSVESFEDVDIVIDASGPFTVPLKMGSGGGAAFNESKITADRCVFYGKDCFSEFDENEKGEITLVGSSKEAMSFLLKCRPYLESGKTLNIVTSEASCFAKAYEDESVASDTKSQVKELISHYLKKWKVQCDDYSVAVKEWRDLPDHERRKKDPPAMPEPQLKIYESYSITSVDKLLDRDKLFLTLEMPPWRDPDQEKNPMMTLPQDKIYVLTGFGEVSSVGVGLRADEPGFYHLEALKTKFCNADIIFHIEKDLMRFFSKA